MIRALLVLLLAIGALFGGCAKAPPAPTMGQPESSPEAEQETETDHDNPQEPGGGAGVEKEENPPELPAADLPKAEQPSAAPSKDPAKADEPEMDEPGDLRNTSGRKPKHRTPPKTTTDAQKPPPKPKNPNATGADDMFDARDDEPPRDKEDDEARPAPTPRGLLEPGIHRQREGDQDSPPERAP